jgi:hypothetical protein
MPSSRFASVAETFFQPQRHGVTEGRHHHPFLVGYWLLAASEQVHEPQMDTDAHRFGRL